MLSSGGIYNVILSEAKDQREAISLAQTRMTAGNRLRLHIGGASVKRSGA
jgi:hypothetical protein